MAESSPHKLSAPPSSQTPTAQPQDLQQNSPYPAAALEATASLLQTQSSPKLHDKDDDLSILDSVEPTPGPPSYTPNSTDRSPDNPFRTMRQVKLFNCFQALGVFGLARLLYDECKEELERNQHQSDIWKKMIDDRDNSKHNVERLLSMLPDAVIESLIKGTFAYDLENEPKVKEYYNLCMRPGAYPGIYLHMMAYPQVEQSGAQTHSGRWLSPRQVQKLCGAYTAYLDDTDKPFNDAVHAMFGGEMGARPWAQIDHQVILGREWVAEIRQQYCENVDPMDMDTPHLKAPIMTGWSEDIQERIPQHAENSSTSCIFGFNNAFIQLAPSKGGFGFTWQPRTAILFPVWEPDQSTAQVAQILASLLTGSYWYHGGYNTTYAAGMTTPETEDPEIWDRAQENARSRLEHCKAPGELTRKFADVAENLASYQTWEEDRKPLDDLMQQLREEKAKTAEIMERRDVSETAYRAKAVEHAKFQKDHLERVEAADPDLGKQLKHIAELVASANRIDEEIRRRAGYGGLLSVSPQNLSPEELAEVEAREEGMKKNTEDAYQEAKKRLAARKEAARKQKEATALEATTSSQLSSSRQENLPVQGPSSEGNPESDK